MQLHKTVGAALSWASAHADGEVSVLVKASAGPLAVVLFPRWESAGGICRFVPEWDNDYLPNQNAEEKS